MHGLPFTFLLPPGLWQVDYYVSSAFGRAFYDSCKDVVYPVLNQKAMTYVGG